MDIFEIYTSLGVRKTTKTLLKTCLKLRNKLKSKCVQFFETPCILNLNLSKKIALYNGHPKKLLYPPTQQGFHRKEPEVEQVNPEGDPFLICKFSSSCDNPYNLTKVVIM